jgi:protoporphyrinogen oxidase
MVAAADTVWLGLEYFCDEGDSLWSLEDTQLMRLGAEELATIGLINVSDVLDGTVIRTKDAYPAYTGVYNQFATIRSFVDGIENLFLVGRNGMHRYNNQDHSMLTAMTAVDNICERLTSKENVWAVNTEQDYHEQRG